MQKKKVNLKLIQPEFIGKNQEDLNYAKKISKELNLNNQSMLFKYFRKFRKVS